MSKERIQKGGQMLKHMDLESPVGVRKEAQSVNGPLAILNEYYDVYVTEPQMQNGVSTIC